MSKISDLVGSTFFMVMTILLFIAAASYLAIIMSKFYGWDKIIAKAISEKGKAVSNKAPAGKTSVKKAPVKKAPVKKKPAQMNTATKKQPPKNIRK